MERDIEPTSYGERGRVLPSLQSVAMAEVVCRFPVVEGLVAILNRGKQGGDGVGDQKNVECRDWLDSIWARRVSGITVGMVSRWKIEDESSLDSHLRPTSSWRGMPQDGQMSSSQHF